MFTSEHTELSELTLSELTSKKIAHIIFFKKQGITLQEM